MGNAFERQHRLFLPFHLRLRPIPTYPLIAIFTERFKISL